MAVPQRKEVEYSQQQPSYKKAANDRTRDTLRVGAAANDSSYSSIRRVGTDRSDLHPDIRNRGSARNVRISNMPGNTKAGEMTTHKSTDQQFSEEYAKKGLQPSSLADKQVRQPYKPIEQIDRGGIADQDPGFPQEPPYEPETPPPAAARALRKSVVAKAKKTAARLKARGLNKAILSAGLFLWSIFQVPFALMLTIIFLAAASLDQLLSSVSAPKSDDGWLTSAAKWVADKAISGASKLLSYVNDIINTVLGIDLTSVIEGLFGLLYAVMMAYGVIVLFTIYLVYKVALLDPLSGEKAGLKIGLFLLAIVGYTVPILNLFPWFIPWTFVVGRYPK